MFILNHAGSICSILIDSVHKFDFLLMIDYPRSQYFMSNKVLSLKCFFADLIAQNYIIQCCYAFIIISLLGLSPLLMAQDIKEFQYREANRSTISDSNSGSANARGRVVRYGFIYGLATGISQQPYIDVNTNYVVFPFIGYRGDRLNILGPFVSYRVKRDDYIDFALHIQPRFDGYEASDSPIFEGMKDRDLSIDVGLSLTHKKNDWKAQIKGLGDILGRSNGKGVTLNLGKTIRNGPFFFEPNVGLEFLDSQYVDYYYGVSLSEATIERSAYEGRSAFSYSFGVSFRTPILFNGFTRLSLSYKKLGSNITKSQLVDGDQVFNIQFAFSKYFR